MNFDIDKFKPSYQRKNGLTIGFLLFCFLGVSFKEDTFDRTFAYLFHILGIINYGDLKTKYPNLNDTDLLREVFFVSRNNKVYKLKLLREITGIKSKDLFRKHFETYFEEMNYTRRRVFTLEETYNILNFWNPDFKGESLQLLLKTELASIYTTGDYDLLEETFIDNNIMSLEAYKNVKKIPPKLYNQLDETLERGNANVCFYFLFLLNYT
ncbi:hypothetical protein [Corallibacter sp.]|uniref:hypothetical protein n=1 Tax=Corallibacter sp. TaxID=2038084 RepID=UPI003AB65136